MKLNKYFTSLSIAFICLLASAHALTEEKPCPTCLGTGKCYTSDIGEASKRYCNGDKKCHWCNGQGWVYNYGSDKKSVCPTCRGDKKCKRCNGTGRCPRCKGTKKVGTPSRRF